jgi:hypothetical protein
MLKNKSIFFAAFIFASSGLYAIHVDAKDMGLNGDIRGDVRTRTETADSVSRGTFSTSADADDHIGVRRSMRHHRMMHRPFGWSHGHKRGWNCTVGETNCVPPGHRY